MNTSKQADETPRGVEMEPFPPSGYVILKAVARDGKLVAKLMVCEEVATPEAMQFRADRMWGAIEEYEVRCLGRLATPSSPQAPLRIL